MLELRSGEQQTAFFQVNQYFRISLFAEGAGPRGFLGHFTFAINQLYEGQVVATANLSIVFTEGRSDVNHTGTVGQSYVISTGYKVCFLVLTFADGFYKIIQRLVFFAFQILTGVVLQNLGFLAQYAGNQSLSHVVGVLAQANLHIAFDGVHTQSHVGGQSPGGGGPSQEVSILADHFEANDSGALFYILVALSHFMAGQRGTAAGAVRHDLEALIQQAFVEDLLQSPPFGLDIIVGVGNVGVIHVGPVANDAGEVLPHSFVFPNTLFTFLDKGSQTVFFDLLFAVQTQLFLDFQLNGQTVGVPTGLTGYHVTLHGAVTGDHILNYTGQYVTDVGFAVGSGGAVIKSIGRTVFALFDTLCENVFLFPKFQNFAFAFGKVHIGRYFLIHFEMPP